MKKLFKMCPSIHVAFLRDDFLKKEKDKRSQWSWNIKKHRFLLCLERKTYKMRWLNWPQPVELEAIQRQESKLKKFAKGKSPPYHWPRLETSKSDLKKWIIDLSMRKPLDGSFLKKDSQKNHKMQEISSKKKGNFEKSYITQNLA